MKLIHFVYICRNNNDDKNNKKDLFHGFNPEEQLEQVILDLFSAGVETLKTSILWSMVYMLHNPDVMKKVQDELDTVIGSERLPAVKDMSKQFDLICSFSKTLDQREINWERTFEKKLFRWNFSTRLDCSVRAEPEDKTDKKNCILQAIKSIFLASPFMYIKIT